MHTLSAKDMVKCPHCGKTQEEPVEDFVVPGRTGEASMTESDCIWCDGLFSVEAVSVTEFVVREI